MAHETHFRTNRDSCCTIELTDTVEDYLKAIFAITSLGEPASTSGIAGRLGVTSPSVTAMLHKLRGNGLVAQAAWGHVTLTEHGHTHARRVVRRHRLLETFLHRVLGVSWDEIHAEAEVLEHHLSRRLEDLIDAALGFPERDPHGDPIPSLVGKHEEHGETPLARSRDGGVFLVQRVYDTDSTALRQLAELDIRPGVSIEIEPRSSEVAPMWVRVAGRRCCLSCAVVNLIHGKVLAPAVAS
jgi:DtxR family Mn-dependent transcriptional regulator